ncbi:hypothetical protein ATN00_21830 (plasmid) [Sphingobium baderi]|uniref:Uncharacterized protein n=2 Tax=Sphingobium baderi TaxID=1332080 RepID=A0A0S3F6S9_9SPHN|nr:hypothetical protein ATN00_21830 [Sphingobium baderi]
MESVPDREHVLLAFASADPQYEYLLAEGAIVDGEYLEGPGFPCAWMPAPPAPSAALLGRGHPVPSELVV